MHDCCRLVNWIEQYKIDLMRKGAESDGIFRCNAQHRIEEGTNWGWVMTDEERGYPCEKLDEEVGCMVYDKRPNCCKLTGSLVRVARKLPQCGFNIVVNEEGNDTVIGECHRCRDT